MLSLPIRVLGYLLEFVPPNEVYRLKLVNKAWYQRIKMVAKNGISLGKEHALRHGMIETVILIKDEINPKSGNDLAHACSSGSMALVNFVLYLYMRAPEPRPQFLRMLSQALCDASGGGHLAIVKKLMNLGAIDINDAIFHACINSKFEVIEYLLDTCEWHPKMMYELCKLVKIECIKFVSDYIIQTSRQKRFMWDEGLQGAHVHGRDDVINLMLEYGASNWGMAFLGACEGGDFNRIQSIIQNHEIDRDYWIWGFYKTCKYCSIDVVKLVHTELIHDGYRLYCFEINDAHFNARNNSKDVIEYLRSVLI